MKKFRVMLVEISLLILIASLLILAYKLVNISGMVSSLYPEFSNMRYPLLILLEFVFLVTVLALIFGFSCLILYKKDCIFDKRMYRGLQNIGLSFIAGIFLMILIIFYTNLNLSASITNVFIYFGIFIYLIISQIFFILSDLVSEGISLKEENDLTIWGFHGKNNCKFRCRIGKK